MDFSREKYQEILDTLKSRGQVEVDYVEKNDALANLALSELVLRLGRDNPRKLIKFDPLGIEPTLYLIDRSEIQ